MKLRNRPGVQYLAIWGILFAGSAYMLCLSINSVWYILVLMLYGAMLSVPAYSLSHECAHKTFVKSAWLNSTVNWLSSLIYLEEPNLRYAARMRHHNFTWQKGIDVQIPFKLPVTFVA